MSSPPADIEPEEDARPEYLKALIQRRKDTKLKQGAVAREMDVTQQSISLIERAKREPTVPTLESYATVVGAELVVSVVDRDSAAAELLALLPSLEEKHVATLLRFARLLPVLERRDYRMWVKDLDILEEDYIVPVEDDDRTARLQGA